MYSSARAGHRRSRRAHGKEESRFTDEGGYRLAMTGLKIDYRQW
jgi:hypothetical protein